MREYQVTRLGLLVAREACLHERFVAWFAVGVKVTKPPTACAGVFCGIFDHELHVRLGSGNERLVAAKDFVVFFRGDVTVMQSSKQRPASWGLLR